MFYLRSRLKYRDEILHCVAQRQPYYSKSWKFKYFKIQDGGRPPFWKIKIAIYPQPFKIPRRNLYGAAQHRSAPYQSWKLEYLKFKIAACCHLKMLYLQNVHVIAMTFCMVMHSATLYPAKHWKFEFLKIQDSGRPLFCKNALSPQPFKQW